MKFKDIEKSLKREHDDKRVPDVCARAKKAPLNKLLTGETPIRAFQKRFAIMMLIFVLAIFVVIIVASAAMLFSTSDTDTSPDCYAVITVERRISEIETGESVVCYTRLGLIVRSEYDIVTIAAEVRNGEISATPFASYSSQINMFIRPKIDDKVSICVFCDDITRAYSVARNIANDIDEIYADVDFKVSAICNDYSKKDGWTAYIESCGGILHGDENVAQIIKVYMSLF